MAGPGKGTDWWHRSGVKDAIEAAGAKLLHLPPCSPDLNPIEMMFAKLKALLRKAAKRNVDGLRQAIGNILNQFTPKECRNDLEKTGYGST